MAAADLGHHHVGEEEVDLRCAAPGDEPLCVVAMGCFQHFVTEAAEESNGEMAHADFVFEHEDRFGSGGRSFLGRFLVGRCRRRRDAGQKNTEGCAVAELALHTNLAAALPDDAVAGGEAEAAVAGLILGREEWLEKPRLHFVAHSDAVVCQRDARRIRRAKGRVRADRMVVAPGRPRGSRS